MDIPALRPLYSATNQVDLVEAGNAVLNLGPDKLPQIMSEKYNIPKESVASLMFDLMLYSKIEKLVNREDK